MLLPTNIAVNQRPSGQVRARSLSGFAELVTELGGSSETLLERVGLSAGVAIEPDASFEHIKLMQLLELAAKELDRADFGLRLARRQGIEVLGPVALIAQHEPTVGRALAAISRNMLYHSPSARVQLHTGGWSTQLALPQSEPLACLSYRAGSDGGAYYRHNTELAYAIAANFLRLISQQPSHHWQICFTHSAAMPLPLYRDYLGCQPIFEQPFEGLFFPAALLDQPINSDGLGDANLAATAARFVAHTVRCHPLDIVLQVVALVEQQLASGRVTLPFLAAQLSLSARSLQRRLAEQGVTFSAVVDAVRRRTTEKLLLQEQLSLLEVGAALGYSEAGSFNRACRRWFGATPLHYRRSVQCAQFNA